MRRLVTFVTLTVSGLILCWANAAAKPDPRTYLMRLERGSRLAIAARINGHGTMALLDSAAEATIIDRGWAQELNLSHGQAVTGQGSGNGAFAAQLVTGVTLEALGLRLKDQTIAVADLSDIGRRLLHHRACAILGREIFDAARLSIDIEGGRISVIGRAQEPRGIRLDLITEHGLETVPVRVESGDPVRATFDLGNGGQVLIGAAFAQRMHFLSDGRKTTAEQGGGLGGEATRQVFRLHTLEIAGRTLTEVDAAVDPNSSASDVNVGVSVLRQFRITTDFANHAVWLDPRK